MVSIVIVFEGLQELADFCRGIKQGSKQQSTVIAEGLGVGKNASVLKCMKKRIGEDNQIIHSTVCHDGVGVAEELNEWHGLMNAVCSSFGVGILWTTGCRSVVASCELVLDQTGLGDIPKGKGKMH